MLPQEICVEINSIISLLIRHGFVDKFNFCSIRNHAGATYVEYDGVEDLSIALKDQPYAETYRELLKREQFTFKLLDGALVQMLYKFDCNRSLIKHRLCFMPSPFNDEYQNEPELYIEDMIFAEVVERKILPVTLRFDYDPNNAAEVRHPHSHFTLGQYSNCRIATCGPLSPSVFTEFILRSFYNTAFLDTSDIFSMHLSRFPETISENERRRLHLAIA